MAQVLLILATAVLVTGQTCTYPAKTPGLHGVTLPSGGTTREFFVSVPENLDSTKLYPAIIMFHGCGSSPMKFEFESSMNVRANEMKFFNVYPQGTTTNTRLGWNAGFSECSTDKLYNDVEFTRALHAWMVANLCINPDQIFVAGFSNGGSMTMNLTCEMNDVFAGFSFTGSTMPPAAFPSSATCGGGLRLNQIKPIQAICGERDGCHKSMDSWFKEYSGLMSCGDSVVEDRVSATTTCYSHFQCGPHRNRTIEYCSVDNLGHCWSRGGGCCDSQCLNQPATNVDASLRTLNFFQNIINSQAENDVEVV